MREPSRSRWLPVPVKATRDDRPRVNSIKFRTLCCFNTCCASLSLASTHNRWHLIIWEYFMLFNPASFPKYFVCLVLFSLSWLIRISSFSFFFVPRNKTQSSLQKTVFSTFFMNFVSYRDSTLGNTSTPHRGGEYNYLYFPFTFAIIMLLFVSKTWCRVLWIPLTGVPKGNSNIR